MDPSYKSLLDKYLNSQLTPEEFELLIQKLDSNDANDAKILERLWRDLDHATYFTPQESKKILQDIKLRIRKEGGVRRKHVMFTAGWRKVAAVFLGLVMVGILYLMVFDRSDHIIYTTAYGETKTIVLPDSSVVTLNANSKLRLADNWYDQETGKISLDSRQLWLEGEGFFEVRKVRASDDSKIPFLVYTQNVEVKVLGTAFNVNHRRGKTELVLNSGAVELNSTVNDHVKNVIMEPGEMVAVDDQGFTKKEVDTKIYTSWKDREFFFVNTPMSEIAKILEDNYGYKVIIADPEIYEMQFNARISARNVNILFKLLAGTFKLEVLKDGNQITLKKK